jgi:hypothetical protein
MKYRSACDFIGHFSLEVLSFAPLIRSASFPTEVKDVVTRAAAYSIY